jgi:hypothetical protein
MIPGAIAMGQIYRETNRFKLLKKKIDMVESGLGFESKAGILIGKRLYLYTTPFLLFMKPVLFFIIIMCQFLF